MGKVKNAFQNMSIRKSLLLTIMATVFFICILSSVAIYFSNIAQQKILEQQEWILDTSILHKGEQAGTLEGTIQNEAIRRAPLSVKQQIAYYGCYISMIGLPALFVMSGIIFASQIYYHLKLHKPIEKLQNAITNIEENNLDISISPTSDDELGALCFSMETMRTELRQSNKKMWELLEQRKTLNASVAHDLRTPITVLKGYLDYLKKNVPQGKLTNEALMETVSNMQEAVGRLERYVECVRDIENIENIQVQCCNEDVAKLCSQIEDDIHHLTTDKKIVIANTMTSETVYIDKQLLFRVLENLLQNAVRFAEHQINITIHEDGLFLYLCVRDDGKGFSSTVIERGAALLYTEEKEQGHFGIGLGICKILCEKLGGSLFIGNNQAGGAYVLAKIKK